MNKVRDAVVVDVYEKGRRGWEPELESGWGPRDWIKLTLVNYQDDRVYPACQSR